ncbi:hypothetical protein ACIPPQ_20390 [Sphingopyxis sp. LARHCG72]
MTDATKGADVEAVARALFVFQHQGDIADPGRTWDAPDKGEHPIYWQQKMEHNHPHYRAMAAAALAASSHPASAISDATRRMEETLGAKFVPASAMDTLQRLGQEMDERPCRHCNGTDPHCSVCEGVGSLPGEPVQKVHELPPASAGDRLREAMRDIEQRCPEGDEQGDLLDDDIAVEVELTWADLREIRRVLSATPAQEGESDV